MSDTAHFNEKRKPQPPIPTEALQNTRQPDKKQPQHKIFIAHRGWTCQCGEWFPTSKNDAMKHLEKYQPQEVAVQPDSSEVEAMTRSQYVQLAEPMRHWLMKTGSIEAIQAATIAGQLVEEITPVIQSLIREAEERGYKRGLTEWQNSKTRNVKHSKLSPQIFAPDNDDIWSSNAPLTDTNSGEKL